MEELNALFWNSRYERGETGWDMGCVSPPLKAYIDRLTNKELKILIPGAGNAWEAAYLWEQGFSHVWVCDFAPTAVQQFLQRCPDFPANQVICGDFFTLTGSFNLILEQTFFCALSPSLREAYAVKMAQLLGETGTLAGVMFDAPKNSERPPFGGTAAAYRSLFERHFKTVTIEPCRNSIGPRSGQEVFVQISGAV